MGPLSSPLCFELLHIHNSKPRHKIASHNANHINGSKRRKLDIIDKNINNGQNAPSTNHITTYNRYEILESIHDSMDDTETLPNQHTQKVPPSPPIFIDDVIDIQTMIKSIEKDINKEDYQLKIKNNQVKILPTNPDRIHIEYPNRKQTKLLKSLNGNFHTYQLKQERPFRVVLRNIHHSANLDELKLELLSHEVTNITNIRHRITKSPLLRRANCTSTSVPQMTQSLAVRPLLVGPQ
jgi:hypothetical protein